jgi:hypothetical protein
MKNWDFIDEINNKYCCKLCHKEYLKETGITIIKGHFKHNHLNAYKLTLWKKYEDKVIFFLLDG